MVERVEGFETHLQFGLLCEVDVLKERQVEIGQTRASVNIAANRAVNSGLWLGKSSGVKPVRDVLIEAGWEWIADNVGAVKVIVEQPVFVSRIDRIGEALLKGYDSVELPAANGDIGSPIYSIGKFLTSTKR